MGLTKCVAMLTLSCMPLLATTAAGCDDGNEAVQTQSPPRTAPGAPALPPDLIVGEAPSGAKDVVAARNEAKAGDTVVVRGRVGGSVAPFVEGRASFQLIDASLKACGEGNPDDKCETPWDYCCEDPKLIAAHSASVQVAAPDGRPLHVGLKGAGGLKPLSEVTVKGTVAKAADSGALVINATNLHVKP